MSGAYCVYYHLNKANGKVYFGITCSRPKHRWARGKSYRSNPYFANAIEKHGWDGFHHRVLIDGLSKEQAELIEKNLIKWSSSTNRIYGYNIKEGGPCTMCKHFKFPHGTGGAARCGNGASQNYKRIIRDGMYCEEGKLR